MTALEVIAMNRAAYRRTCRRHDILSRVLGFLQCVLLILALTWCYTSRAELANLVYRAWSRQAMATSTHFQR